MTYHYSRSPRLRRAPCSLRGLVVSRLVVRCPVDRRVFQTSLTTAPTSLDGQRDIGPDANQDFRPTICASTSCQDVRLGILEQRDDLFAFNAREALQKLLD